MIDISNMDPADVLRKLYNASKPQGLGFLSYKEEIMTLEDAREWLAKFPEGHPPYFDYLNGRIMKVRIHGDTLDPRLYDRDNGAGAAARALGVKE